MASRVLTFTINPVVVARRTNVGHWVDVPRFEQFKFVVDQAANRTAFNNSTMTQPGVPRTGVVYSSTATYGGTTYTKGQSPTYPAGEQLNVSGVQGVIMRHRWAELEQGTSQATATYTFNRVAGELQQCLDIGNARGKRFGFILFIEVNSFGSTPGGTVVPLPAYLSSFATQEASSGSWNTWRWNTTIRTRFAALVQALGNAFDSHVCWEGIATNETATKAANNDPSYSDTGFRNGLIDETNAIAGALNNGRHFFYQNFFPTPATDHYIDDVVQAGIANGAMVMGGPDILPGNDSLETRVYPRYTGAFRGQLPMFCSFQNDSYNWHADFVGPPWSGSSGGVSPWTDMETMYQYALNTLKLNYIFSTWRRTGTGNHFDNTAATPNPPGPGMQTVIQNHQTFAPTGAWLP